MGSAALWGLTTLKEHEFLNAIKVTKRRRRDFSIFSARYL